MKKQNESVLAFLVLAAIWLIYFEFIYWFLFVVCFDGPWVLVHVGSFVSSIFIIAVTAGSQNKD